MTTKKDNNMVADYVVLERLVATRETMKGSDVIGDNGSGEGDRRWWQKYFRTTIPMIDFNEEVIALVIHGSIVH